MKINHAFQIGEKISLLNKTYDEKDNYEKVILLRQITFKELEKSLKLYDNLQSYILILLEEISYSSSSQLRKLLEEFVRIRDE